MKKNTGCACVALILTAAPWLHAEETALMKAVEASFARRAEPRVWKAESPSGPKEVLRRTVVDFADDLSRHGPGVYPWTKNRATRGLPFTAKEQEEAFVIFRDLDVDGDGRTDDDYVAAIPYSLELPLNTPEWPLGGFYPEQHRSAHYYGGITFHMANAEPGKSQYLQEIGVNPDHQGPYFDDRAEDAPLHMHSGGNDPKAFARYFNLMLWRKSDFLNGGEQGRVFFDENSRMGTQLARYWYNVEEIRFVVQDGDDLFISENHKDIDPEYWPKKNLGWTNGRVFQICPLNVKWAPYHPQAPYQVDFDAKTASFSKRAFKDIQAAGWYIAKSSDQRVMMHTKWYTFQTDAQVERASRPSELIDMKPVDTPSGRLYMANTELPYAAWKKIYRYADCPIYTFEHRYLFYKHMGDMGSMRFGNIEHDQDEPLTNVSFYDAIVACNALSEMESRTPCYYTDPECTQIFRFQEMATRGKAPDGLNAETVYEPIVMPKLYVKWDADGYRLPTPSEWKAALDGNDGWTINQAGTKAVGSGAANGKGLYDLLGNVWELAWIYGDCFDPEQHHTFTVLGGDFHGEGDPADSKRAASLYGDTPWDGNYNIGLRFVRRDARQGKTPEQSVSGIPAWTFAKDETTGRTQEAISVTDSVLKMAAIPAGETPYLAGKKTLTVSVSAFDMATTPTTYTDWKRVYDWAIANGYEFDSEGAMGSMYWMHWPHSPQEPVTGLSWYNCLVWCNALSEMEGRTPFYYADVECTEVYRKAFKLRAIQADGPILMDPKSHPELFGFLRQGRRDQWIFERWDVDGYRLPTLAEWCRVISDGGDKIPWYGKAPDDFIWHTMNAGARTHEVGQKQATSMGIYDPIGNVFQWLNSTEPGRVKTRPAHEDLNNPKAQRFWGYRDPVAIYHSKTYPLRAGGSWFWMSKGDHLVINERNEQHFPDIGFRVVRCQAGTHPRDGMEPLTELIQMELDPTHFDLLK